MGFTVQLSRLFAVVSRPTAHLLYHLLFSLSRTFLFYFFKFFSVVCFSNSDIISCLQFPVNTFLYFFQLYSTISLLSVEKNPPHSEADLSYHYFFFASSIILHFFTYFFTYLLSYQILSAPARQSGERRRSDSCNINDDAETKNSDIRSSKESTC